MVTRLSGGLTPGDGSDPRTFPAIWNVTADEIESQGTAISGAESDIDVLEGKNIPAFGTATPSDGDVLTFDSASSEYVPEAVSSGTAVDGQAIYRYADTVYYTSNETFSKGDYPWLRAIRVKVQGAGGGGGGIESRSLGSESAASAGGSGGGYAESFIVDIAGLAVSETITVGAGGDGGAAGANDGASGGNSSFGSLVVSTGGGGGSRGRNQVGIIGADSQGFGTSGDFLVGGGQGKNGFVINPGGFQGAAPGSGGDSELGFGGFGVNSTTLPGDTSFAGNAGSGYGSGGSGAVARGASPGRAGGDGKDGVVIVELYA